MYHYSIRHPFACIKPHVAVLTFLIFAGTTSLFSQKHLLILNRSGHTIVSVPADGPASELKEEISQGLADPYDMVQNAGDGALYWPEGYGHSIRQARIGSPERSGGTALPTRNVTLPVDIAIDELHHKLYWIDNAAKQIFRANLDGTQEENVPVDSLSNPTSLALIPALDLLFYADLDAHRICSVSLNGGRSTILVKSDAEYPVRLLADPVHGKLYWANDGGHRIERVSLDGTGRHVFYQGGENEYPFGLLIDGESAQLYWTDYGTDQVLRQDLEGSGAPEVVATQLEDPVAMTLSDLPDRNEQASGKSALEKARMQVFPNPANKLLTFQSLHTGQPIEWVRIYDRTGNEVFFDQAGGTVYQLDVNLYADGYYSYIAQVAEQILSGHFSIIH